MRLKDFEIEAIKTIVAGRDPSARVYLFGSRADDTKRGGDIDLLIMSDTLSLDDRGKIRWDLWGKLGEQKIDILIAKDITDPFVKLAYTTGKQL
jgi:uncharacterized protein